VRQKATSKRLPKADIGDSLISTVQRSGGRGAFRWKVLTIQRKFLAAGIDHSSNLFHDFPSRYQIEHTTPQSWHSNADPGRGSSFHSLGITHA